MLATSFKRTVSVIALMSALALGACETTGTGDPQSASAAPNAPATPERAAMNHNGPNGLPDAPLSNDAVSQATYWGARYEDDPDNTELAVNFSTALRHMGSLDEAGSLMARTANQHPDDPAVLTEFARVLVAARRGNEALPPLAQAISRDPDNWELYSLEGVAHDQAGEYDDATQSYEQALNKSPNNPRVLNNYGLSRALAGDLDGAEEMLRTAVAQPGATAQMRQNLALVLGLQGRFDEAERLSRADLPPDAVENNVAYYRAMLTQPDDWDEMNGDDSGQ
jgi:Flp pilus assembly protein TadD